MKIRKAEAGEKIAIFKELLKKAQKRVSHYKGRIKELSTNK